MKKLSLFVLLAALYSCQAIYTLQNQKIKLSLDEVAFDTSQNLWRIPVQIHQKSIPFVFDTGAMFSAIFNADSLCPKELQRAIKFGSVLGADHKKQPQKLVVLPVSCRLFDSENKVFAALTAAQSRCAKPENTLQGILGMDLFFHQEKSLYLSYSTGRIVLKDRPETNTALLEQGYVLLPSKFKRNALFVWAKIENQAFWFKLDSGFTGTTALPFSTKNSFQNPLKTVYEGAAFQTALGHTFGREVFYSKMPLVLGKYKAKLQCVESRTIKEAVLGFKFMQGFDWVFDFRNKQLFAKRNARPIPENYVNLNAFHAVAGDKLRIGLKAVKAKSFSLGDEIVAVNGVKVTDKNRCELEQLLNSTADWNQLELLISSAK